MMPTEPDVRIVEVGPRDGLQNIQTSIPTTTKIELIQRLVNTGLQDVELTSIVSPKAVPQLADNQTLLADSTIQNLLANQSLRLPILIPNARGFEMGLRRGVRDVAVFVSATEAFSKANTNCTVEQGLARAAEIAHLAAQHNIPVRGYVSCIFDDPFSGATPESAVLHVVRNLLDAGCYQVSLGDTLGTGKPADVKRLLAYLYKHGVEAEKLAGHFHDTHGHAIANVCTAFTLGIRTFDSSIGGLGGCPFAPGAKGNVATEELVYLFETAGISTGVDLGKLLQVREWMFGSVVQRRETRDVGLVGMDVEAVEGGVCKKSVSVQA